LIQEIVQSDETQEIILQLVGGTRGIYQRKTVVRYHARPNKNTIEYPVATSRYIYDDVTRL
jgi:hypothetical protein